MHMVGGTGGERWIYLTGVDGVRGAKELRVKPMIGECRVVVGEEDGI